MSHAERIAKLTSEVQDLREAAVLQSALQPIKKMLAKLEAEPEKADYWRAELSDYGINWLRDFASEQGWSRQDLGKMLQEEARRASRMPPTVKGMESYFKVPRVGSHYRLSRSARAAVFAQLVGRKVLKASDKQASSMSFGRYLDIAKEDFLKDAATFAKRIKGWKGTAKVTPGTTPWLTIEGVTQNDTPFAFRAQVIPSGPFDTTVMTWWEVTGRGKNDNKKKLKNGVLDSDTILSDFRNFVLGA